MAKAYQIYTDALHQHFKVLYANWPVGEKISIGDYGIMDGKIFVREGNIYDDFKITIEVLDDKTKDTYSFKSANDVSVEYFMKGELVIGEPLAKARIDIGFSGNNSIFFNAAGITHLSIKNLTSVGANIKDLHKNKKWPPNRIIISRLVVADNSVIAISSGNKSTLSLEAESSNIEKINLSDASIGLTVKKESGISFEIISASGLYPLFGIAGVKPTYQPIAKNGDEFEPKGKHVIDGMLKNLEKVKSGEIEYDKVFIFDNI